MLFLVQAAFEQGRDSLAQHVVTFCENQTDANTTAAYGVVAGQGVCLSEIINMLMLYACDLYTNDIGVMFSVAWECLPHVF